MNLARKVRFIRPTEGASRSSCSRCSMSPPRPWRSRVSLSASRRTTGISMARNIPFARRNSLEPQGPPTAHDAVHVRTFNVPVTYVVNQADLSLFAWRPARDLCVFGVHTRVNKHPEISITVVGTSARQVVGPLPPLEEFTVYTLRARPTENA